METKDSKLFGFMFKKGHEQPTELLPCHRESKSKGIKERTSMPILVIL